MYYILCVLEHSMALLRFALREQLQRPDERLPSLQSALAELAVLVRENGTQAEQFVILIKQEWDSAVHEHVNGDASLHQQMRQAVVTSAIKAYYLQ